MSDSKSKSSRREFLGHVGRGVGALAVGGLVWRLVAGRDGNKVWQLDPSVCDGCAMLNDRADGLSRCSTDCVLKRSAVKAVNDFTQCGYCRECPGYHDPNPQGPREKDGPDKGLPIGRVCPYDAIVRKQVGFFDPDDPKNTYYEYTIDLAKCTGCGKCVVGCGKPGQGNGSLRLEIRQDLCVHCNQCAIARACPAPHPPRTAGYLGAFYPDRAANRWPSKTKTPGPKDWPIQDNSPSDSSSDAQPDGQPAGLPCGPSPVGRLSVSSEGQA